MTIIPVIVYTISEPNNKLVSEIRRFYITTHVTMLLWKFCVVDMLGHVDGILGHLDQYTTLLPAIV